MVIAIAVPAQAAPLSGNRVTAERWARRLRELGHRVTIGDDWRGEACDVLIALHARKSFAAIERFHSRHADSALVVALTGTDLYEDTQRCPTVARALAMATRVVVLQEAALTRLPAPLRAKAAVIHQSAVMPEDVETRSASDAFEVCLLSHLREVKDPLLAARAARHLPEASTLVIRHAGAALDPVWAQAARKEERSNRRYSWLGALPRERALRFLASSRLLLLTSRAEGGANVLSEAIACGVPVLSTRIDGSVGLLGSHYPGYFEPGDDRALAVLLARAEAESAFYDELRKRIEVLRPLVAPERERAAWSALVQELAGSDVGP